MPNRDEIAAIVRAEIRDWLKATPTEAVVSATDPLTVTVGGHNYYPGEIDPQWTLAVGDRVAVRDNGFGIDVLGFRDDADAETGPKHVHTDTHTHDEITNTIVWTPIDRVPGDGFFTTFSQTLSADYSHFVIEGTLQSTSGVMSAWVRFNNDSGASNYDTGRVHYNASAGTLNASSSFTTGAFFEVGPQRAHVRIDIQNIEDAIVGVKMAYRTRSSTDADRRFGWVQAEYVNGPATSVQVVGASAFHQVSKLDFYGVKAAG